MDEDELSGIEDIDGHEKRKDTASTTVERIIHVQEGSNHPHRVDEQLAVAVHFYVVFDEGYRKREPKRGAILHAQFWPQLSGGSGMKCNTEEAVELTQSLIAKIFGQENS